MSTFLEDLTTRRGYNRAGGNPTRLIERAKGSDILYQFYEPDPFTTREPYYYNTRINKLFKKIEFVELKSDKKSAAWKDITEF